MNKTILLRSIIIIFILSLIPLYFIGKYDHPSVDDYYYGAQTVKVWNDTHNVGSVVKESYNQMVDTYYDWQGNFSAIFLMRLQPAIFGEQYYILAPIFLITSFVVCMMIFFYSLLRKWFNAGSKSALGVAVCVTFCAMQFTFMPSDSFYWYNGSIYYTFFFSLMLLLFTLITTIVHSEKKWAVILSSIIAVPLAFVIGGGNYSTALFTVVILATMTAFFIYKKDKKSILVAIITICCFVGLVISMKAPGNEIRKGTVESPGVIKALIYSFAYGGYNIANSSTAPVLIMWIGLLPVFYMIASKINFSFKKPLLVLLFTYCIFCTQGTPVFYAQGLRIPYRMMNIIYFSYYIFMTINLIYLMGWLHQKYGESQIVQRIFGVYDNARACKIFSLVIPILFVVGCIGKINVTEKEDGGASFSNLPMSLSAAYSIVNGDAKEYDAQLNNRDQLIKLNDSQFVVVPKLTVTPDVIYHTDITDNPEDWHNAHLALFYDKDAIWTE